MISVMCQQLFSSLGFIVKLLFMPYILNVFIRNVSHDKKNINSVSFSFYCDP